MKIEEVKISQVKLNPNNPRSIRDKRFNSLVKSVQDFPEMLKIRPIVVDADYMVLGGNMRLRACKKAGMKTVWIIKADELTEEQKREFIIKDNVGFGDWDFDLLANSWDQQELIDWGMEDVSFFQVEEEAKEDKQVFQIMIDCQDEDEQSVFLQKLKNQGYKCQKK